MLEIDIKREIKELQLSIIKKHNSLLMKHRKELEMISPEDIDLKIKDGDIILQSHFFC